LHFDKILQIPLIILRYTASLDYREMLEFFSEGKFNQLAQSKDEFPILTEVREFFIKEAQKLQNGGVEFTYSKEWLNVHWPQNEYMFIKLCVEKKFEKFHKEVEKALMLLIKSKSIDFDFRILKDAIKLNKNLIKLPFKKNNLELKLSYNIWEFYQSALLGKIIELKKEKHVHHVNRTTEKWTTWDEWFQKVVWYGNRKGAYLYGNISTDKQLEGHY